jgi:hypothetical protein
MTAAVIQSRCKRWQTDFEGRQADLALGALRGGFNAPGDRCIRLRCWRARHEQRWSALSRRIRSVVGLENALRLGRHNCPRLEQRDAGVAVVPRRM